MSERVHRLPKWITRAIVGLLIGLALGFVVGWWLWPVQYTNTTPAVLRQDYRDDYIVMVATAYGAEGSLQEAQERLRLLDADDPSGLVVELAERLTSTGGSAEDVTRLMRLAEELGALTPTPAPFLESQP